MSETQFKLPKPPIVEAVLDVECDMPPGRQIESLEVRARDCFRDRYPKFQAQFVQTLQIKPGQAEALKQSVQHGLQALRFLSEDQKQIVQVRTSGFSFNRLAPYGSLDDYLPEIERTWQLFVGLSSPVQIRLIRLRYINRILLPLTGGGIELKDYLKVGPELPEEGKLQLTGFFVQQSAKERATDHRINSVLTAQATEGHFLPVIFDLSVEVAEIRSAEDWPWVFEKILALRGLKNRIFHNTLTARCLNLFQ